MEALERDLEELGLSSVALSLPELIGAATREKAGYEEFLASVLSHERTARAANRQAILTRLARFPVPKTLTGFDLSFSPGLDGGLIRELGALRFVREHANVLFLGPPGVGKTHLAIALGMEAVSSGMKTYFTTLEEMISRLMAGAPAMLSRRMGRYLSCQLLIIDEVGYLPLSAAQAHLFFQVISSRYECGSTIITSNKPVVEWGDYLSDPTLAAALLDRFLHHCHVVAIRGASYRLKDKMDLVGKAKAKTPKATPTKRRTES